MSRTLQDLMNRIAADLSRDDLTGDYLTSPIANAVGDSIRFYARERFWFNQTKTAGEPWTVGSRTSGAALYFPALHRMGWRIAGLKALPSARRGTVKF